MVFLGSLPILDQISISYIFKIFSVMAKQRIRRKFEKNSYLLTQSEKYHFLKTFFSFAGRLLQNTNWLLCTYVFKYPLSNSSLSGLIWTCRQPTYKKLHYFKEVILMFRTVFPRLPNILEENNITNVQATHSGNFVW